MERSLISKLSCNELYPDITQDEDGMRGCSGSFYFRAMEILSEHTCHGWPDGHLLAGRHGLFSCYEAFIHIVDSMFNQHAKGLKVCREIPWRRPIASPTSAHLACLAPGSQRLFAPEPRFHRP